MTDIKAAAERLRRMANEGSDAWTLARWALPLLEETPIDEAWLMSAGFEQLDDKGSGCFRQSADGCTQISWGYRGQWLVNRVELDEAAQPNTRGALRRLAMALEITLNETP